MTDYTKMSSPELLQACGGDGHEWAEAFCQYFETHKPEISRSIMAGWFANAIEHSSDVRHWRKLKTEHEALVAFLEKERKRKQV